MNTRSFSLSSLTALVATLCLLVGSGMAGAVSGVQAQTATPSAELREIIRQRLEQTLAGDTRERFVGVIGSVTRVSTSTFTLVDPSGRERTIVIDPSATSFVGTNQVRSFSDMAIESGVAVIGSSTDGVLINARRVIPAAAPFTETRRVALGSVDVFDRNLLTLRERGSDQVTTVTVNTTTKFEDILGNPVPRTSVQEDESLLVVIQEEADGDLIAKRVRLLVAATE